MFVDIQKIINKYNMNQKVNYDVVYQDVVKQWESQKDRPKVLMHSCCAPCSTYVLEEMVNHADVTIFYSNSNIYPREEYTRRAIVQKQFIEDFNEKTGSNVQFIEDDYRPDTFLKAVHERELKEEPEGGKRCDFCFEMRLDRVAEKAQELGFEYFGSALTLSPHKNSKLINEIGMDVQVLYDVSYLPSDFKKRGGYQRSIEMCNDYDIYRQCYCGCVFSANQWGVDLKSVKQEAKSFVERYREDHKHEKEEDN